MHKGCSRNIPEHKGGLLLQIVPNRVKATKAKRKYHGFDQGTEQIFPRQTGDSANVSV